MTGISSSDDEASAECSTDDLASSASGGSEAEAGMDDDFRGTTFAQTVFNIVKNIVGEGMLSLPAGVAAGTGFVVAMGLASFFCALMGYTFAGVGRVCFANGKHTHTTYKEAGSAVVGPRFGKFMAIVLMIKTAFSCVSYSMVIGDTYSRILHFFGLTQWFTYKQSVLVIIMVCILTPLCMQRDLSVLAYFSLFGVLCELFVVAFMTVRYFDGSYFEGGMYFNTIAAKDRRWFRESGSPDYLSISLTTFILLGSLSTAFTAHYNAPKFYCNMRHRSPRRFTHAVQVAYTLAFLIYVACMTVGYLTFGEHCEGLILNNYAESDVWATVSRIAIGFAVMVSFPLSFLALRDSTLSVFGLPPEKRRFFYGSTAILIASITCAGCELSDLGLINSLCGVLLGALITLVFPGLLFYFSARAESKSKIKQWARGEKALSLVTVGMGSFLVVFGTTIVLLKQFRPEALGLHKEVSGALVNGVAGGQLLNATAAHRIL